MKTTSHSLVSGQYSAREGMTDGLSVDVSESHVRPKAEELSHIVNHLIFPGYCTHTRNTDTDYSLHLEYVNISIQKEGNWMKGGERETQEDEKAF